MGDEQRRSSSTKEKQQRQSKKKSSKPPPPTAEEQLRSAEETLERMDGSPFFVANPPRTFPSFERTEVGLGKKLGFGAFCNVHEVLAMRLRPSSPSGGNGGAPTPSSPSPAAATARTSRSTSAGSCSSEDVRESSEGPGGGGGAAAEDDPETTSGAAEANGAAANDGWRDDGDGEEEEGASDDRHDGHYDMIPDIVRTFMAEECIRDGDARYAFKRLRPDLAEFDRTKGIVDLATECKFLSSIYHPNIIKMRGRAAGDMLGPDFFFVMDRLYDTLEERIDGAWKERHRLNSGCLGCFGGNKDELAMLMVERLTAAYDMASAFRYLHSHKLVYRDIKPDNMGFDVRGDIKVFDFGLCKELTPKLKAKDGLYKLTGLTGSRRYMAPEVVLCKPYNHTADVFSYGILFWQMLALQTPFEQFDPHEYTERVVKRGYRPAISPLWPVYICGIVRECWSGTIGDRPEFSRIASVIKGELTQLVADAGGSIHNRTSHMMRKSQHSFRLRREEFRDDS